MGVSVGIADQRDAGYFAHLDSANHNGPEPVADYIQTRRQYWFERLSKGQRPAWAGRVGGMYVGYMALNEELPPEWFIKSTYIDSGVLEALCDKAGVTVEQITTTTPKDEVLITAEPSS